MRILLLFVILTSLIPGCDREKDPEILFENGDYVTAFNLWKPQAQNGDLDAMNYLGIHYYLGLGVRRDLASAKSWFEQAAKLGHPNAQYNMGMMYENGESVQQDFILSYMWFYASYVQGSKKAEKKMVNLREEMNIFPNQQKHAQELAKPYIITPVK